jgi:hypothetical protein
MRHPSLQFGIKYIGHQIRPRIKRPVILLQFSESQLVIIQRNFCRHLSRDTKRLSQISIEFDLCNQDTSQLRTAFLSPKVLIERFYWIIKYQEHSCILAQLAQNVQTSHPPTWELHKKIIHKKQRVLNNLAKKYVKVRDESELYASCRWSLYCSGVNITLIDQYKHTSSATVLLLSLAASKRSHPFRNEVFQIILIYFGRLYVVICVLISHSLAWFHTE